MLLFYGRPCQPGGVDESTSRAARLEALRTHFYAWKGWKDFSPDKPFRPLAAKYLLDEVKNNKNQLKNFGEAAKVIVLNAHGSATRLGPHDASSLAEFFVDLGIQEAGTREIWLAACDNGLQKQDNKGPEPLAKELLREFRTRYGIDIKVYAPRGWIRYRDRSDEDVGRSEEIIHYGNVTIFGDIVFDEDGKVIEGHNYLFQDGWVMAHF